MTDCKVEGDAVVPLHMREVIVCVVPDVNLNVFPTFTVSDAKVLFPVIIISGPVITNELNVSPPPANVLPDPVILIIDVPALNVKLVVVVNKKLTLQLTVDAPSVKVLTLALLQLNEPQVTVFPFVFNEPFDKVIFKDVVKASCSVHPPPTPEKSKLHG